MIQTSLDTFDRDIIFFFGDYKKVIKFAKKEEIYEEELFYINLKLSRWRTILTSNGWTICWIKDKKDYWYIAHEIFHCVDFILRQIWITLSEDSDEVYAYSIQSITNQLYSKIK